MSPIILLSLLALLSGCTTPALWSRPGATAEEFAQDRYDCLRASTVPYSSGAVNPYFGTSSSGMAADARLFMWCMEARGWVLKPQ